MKMKSHGFWLVMVCLTIALKGLAQEAPAPRRFSGVTSSNNNPLQIAILHWYNANLTTSFSVGLGPEGVAFDGANIWVANQVSNNVTKLRASDGSNLGTLTVGHSPDGVALMAPTSGWRT